MHTLNVSDKRMKHTLICRYHIYLLLYSEFCCGVKKKKKPLSVSVIPLNINAQASKIRLIYITFDIIAGVATACTSVLKLIIQYHPAYVLQKCVCVMCTKVYKTLDKQTNKQISYKIPTFARLNLKLLPRYDSKQKNLQIH